jgi:LPXTG-motif cell wall-anchored protein
MKKLALALVAMSAVIFGTGLATHADYPPGAGTVTATPATLAPGGTFVATATCETGEIVTFVFEGVTETATCTAEGVASVNFTAPDADGSYDGTAVGSENGALGSFTVTVATTPPPVTQGGATNGGGTLPSTGSNGTNTGLIIGVGSLLVGLGLFATARTRRNQDVSTGSIR